jgi:hypothetical protein
MGPFARRAVWHRAARSHHDPETRYGRAGTVRLGPPRYRVFVLAPLRGHRPLPSIS